MKRSLQAALAVAICVLGAQATMAATVFVTNPINVDETWTADNEYILTEVVYVTSGATLTIDPGTVIRGEGESSPGANDPGTLVITRGSKIRALGTKLKPIIFTDLNDDNIGSNPGTFPYNDKDAARLLTGQWGGVILLGYGYVANATGGGPDASREVQIEGLVAAGGLGLYGNCASSSLAADECDDDDSGTMHFVSIRYGGFNLSADNEINGLTLGAVGRETDFDYIDIFQTKDDAMESFGGAPQIKHFLGVSVGDDGIDYDEGCREKIQFALIAQGTPGSDKSDKGGEWDGGNGPDSSQPMSITTLYNVTMVGHGGNGAGVGDPIKAYTGKNTNTAMHIRDNGAGRIYNSFFADFGGSVIQIEGGASGTSGTAPNTSGERSQTAYVIDNNYYRGPASQFQLELRDNSWYCFGDGSHICTGLCDDATTPCESNAACVGIGTGTCNGDSNCGGDAGKIHHDPGIFTNAAFNNTYLTCADPLPIRALTRTPAAAGVPDPIILIDPRPVPGQLTTTRTPPDDGFFEPAPYMGAMGDYNWADGWSTMARLGYFPAKPQVLITGNITTSDTWTHDNEYVLDNVIYVTNGATLTIEPGTVVRGQPESSPGANDPGTLVITRGSKLIAKGTECDPIVFTDLFDDNLGTSLGTFPYNDKDAARLLTGQWGGVIILGYGYVANATGGGADQSREVQIEGLVAAGGLGLYGNCASSPLSAGNECDDDDSGDVEYISIRFGGFNLSADNEINGLTLGAVGRETVLDHIEVFQTKDDIMESFGGAPQIKHLLGHAAGDDGIDYDEGCREKIQFALILEGTPGSDKSDKGGEWDGGNGPDSSQPMSLTTLYNLTMVGHGGNGAPGDPVNAFAGKNTNTAMHIRDNGGGRVYNSLFADFGGSVIQIEGGASGTSGTAPNTSGERSQTAYVIDGKFYKGPESEFQLELRNNDFWCFGDGSHICTGLCDDATTPCESNADCTGIGTGTCNGDSNCGGDAGKIHHDPGLFTNAAFKNTYYSCADPVPFRTLQRTTGVAGSPNPMQDFDPLPAAGIIPTDRNAPSDGFFERAPYKGAFATTNWAEKWAITSRIGYFPICDSATGTGPAPYETNSLSFSVPLDRTLITWDAEVTPGLMGYQLFDVLRRDSDGMTSSDAGDFASASCLETDDADEQVRDQDTPAAGGVYFYLVRAVNPCGDGSLGYGSGGALRGGATCP